MWDIGKVFRRPPAVRPGDRNGGFPRLGVARALRCPASPRHALLAENLGTPSLGVIIGAPWYKTRQANRGANRGASRGTGPQDRDKALAIGGSARYQNGET
jgi:hypothetical protein